MTARHFLTDEQLDEIMGTMPGPDALPVATLDQLQAATREASALGQNMALAAIARGGWAFLGDAPKDVALIRRMVKPRLRMLLAAFSTGHVTHLCDHTRQIRPVLILCDPPTLVCMQPACITRLQQSREATQFLWDHHCDCCGQHTETVTPHLTSLGPLSISGHLCRACTALMAEDAVQAAEYVHAITRKSPCPCGSGRRYKRCHGRQETP
ncbi:SEC-C metal-binding domain-containing protein [Streptomyces sp. NPDC051133]|uniref:SEC-C metal-binding domain-containing protein n=1 Tax=Streptomyces sp. NPDC051133 TaxID=3155521 RepID=UPI00341BD8A3